MTGNEPSKIDQVLDLLLDALQERQAARGVQPSVTQVDQSQDSYVNEVRESAPDQVSTVEQDEPSEMEQEPNWETDEEAEHTVIAAPDLPERLPTIHLDRMLGRLVTILLVLVVLINIPFNRYGTNLARAMPDRQALVIRDGLLLKGEGDEIYVLEDNQKRWISSLEAFEYYGFTWEEVSLVDDDFLDQFPSGPPLSILNKCEDSPHVYAIENGVKRWIKDIPTFEEQGYVWEDVQIVSCAALERIPSGPPIPPDAGEPPTP
jgi:hypothetical protein